MIYELLKDLSERLQSAGFDAVIISDEPAVYNINTAYIVFPNEFPVSQYISTDAYSEFYIPIYFITHQCDANRIDLMYQNIEASLNKIIPFIKANIDKLEGNYCDDDMRASTYRYTITPHQWLSAGKILISTRLTLYYKAILTVQNPLNSN